MGSFSCGRVCFQKLNFPSFLIIMATFARELRHRVFEHIWSFGALVVMIFVKGLVYFSFLKAINILIYMLSCRC